MQSRAERKRFAAHVFLCPVCASPRAPGIKYSRIDTDFPQPPPRAFRNLLYARATSRRRAKRCALLHRSSHRHSREAMLLCARANFTRGLYLSIFSCRAGMRRRRRVGSERRTFVDTAAMLRAHTTTTTTTTAVRLREKGRRVRACATASD